MIERAESQFWAYEIDNNDTELEICFITLGESYLA